MAVEIHPRMQDTDHNYRLSCGPIEDNMRPCPQTAVSRPDVTDGQPARRRFGKGLEPWLIADGKILVLDRDMALTVAEATHAGYTELASHTVLEGHDAWGPMALADGRLIIRDLVTMKCLDIGKR